MRKNVVIRKFVAVLDFHELIINLNSQLEYLLINQPYEHMAKILSYRINKTTKNTPKSYF